MYIGIHVITSYDDEINVDIICIYNNIILCTHYIHINYKLHIYL